jgi:hypothetical protein
MKILVLTTQTSHHAFFVREMQVHGYVEVFCETKASPSFPFETSHPFELERDQYEWGKWFDGKHMGIEEIAPTRFFVSLNDMPAVDAMRTSAADLILVFGTAALKPPVLAACQDRIFNLHGGDPEEYRGLDTHLWAIYHKEFNKLITTLHGVQAELDAGDIVAQSAVPIRPGMPLHELRSANTEVCVDLCRAAIDRLERNGRVPVRKQRQKGRYYSAMPAALKSICKDYFERYSTRLSP